MVDEALSTHGVGIGDERFRIPKACEPVVLTLDGGMQVSGNVHLCLVSGVHTGRERIIDLLIAPPPFFPVTTEQGTRLVHKRRVITLGFTTLYDAELDDAESEGAAESAVEIELCGVPAERSTLQGRVRIVMPPEQSRVVDYLNASHGFFPLLTDGLVVLVNRHYVVAVRCA